MEPNKYELIQGDNSYIFEAKLEGDLVHLSIENPQNKILACNLSVTELQKLDNTFSSVESAQQGLELLDNILKDHNIAVIEEEQSVKLIFYMDEEDEEKKFEIILDEEIPNPNVAEERVENEIQTNEVDINANIEAPVETNEVQNEEINADTKVELPEEANVEIKEPIAYDNNYPDLSQNIKTNYENVNYDVNYTNQIGTENTYNYDNTYQNNEVYTNQNIYQENITNDYSNALPTGYTTGQIINSNEEINMYGNNYIPSSYETQNYTTTNYTLENNNIPLTSYQTASNVITTYNIQISNVPDETDDNYHNVEMELPKIHEPIDLERPLSSLINDLNELKQKEIDGLNDLVRQIKFDRMQNIEIRKKEEEIKALKSTMKLGENSKKISIKGTIIKSTEELEMISRKIYQVLKTGNKNIVFNLLYKASVDSDKASAFHKKCDQANKTLVLIETDQRIRFGGFTTQNWKGNNIDKKDENAFVFSLDKMKTYDIIEGENAIGCYKNFGPIFLGCQIRIFDNCFTKGGTTFEKGANFNTQEDFELSGGEQKFNVKEIEVYEVIAQ